MTFQAAGVSDRYPGLRMPGVGSSMRCKPCSASVSGLPCTACGQ